MKPIGGVSLVGGLRICAAGAEIGEIILQSIQMTFWVVSVGTG